MIIKSFKAELLFGYLLWLFKFLNVYLKLHGRKKTSNNDFVIQKDL